MAAVQFAKPSQTKVELPWSLRHQTQVFQSLTTQTSSLCAMGLNGSFCIMNDMRRRTTRSEKLKRNSLSILHIFAFRCRLK